MWSVFVFVVVVVFFVDFGVTMHGNEFLTGRFLENGKSLFLS